MNKALYRYDSGSETEVEDSPVLVSNDELLNKLQSPDEVRNALEVTQNTLPVGCPQILPKQPRVTNMEPSSPRPLIDVVKLVAKLPQWQSQASLSSTYDIHEARQLLRYADVKFVANASKELLIAQLLQIIQQGKLSTFGQGQSSLDEGGTTAGVNSWSDGPSLRMLALPPLAVAVTTTLKKRPLAPTPVPATTLVTQSAPKLQKRNSIGNRKASSSGMTGKAQSTLDPTPTPQQTPETMNSSRNEPPTLPTSKATVAREVVVLYRPQDYMPHSGVMCSLERIRTNRQMGSSQHHAGRKHQRAEGDIPTSARGASVGAEIYMNPKLFELSSQESSANLRSCESNLQTELNKAVGGRGGGSGRRVGADTYAHALEAACALRSSARTITVEASKSSQLALPLSETPRIGPSLLASFDDKPISITTPPTADTLHPDAVETALSSLRDKILREKFQMHPQAYSGSTPAPAYSAVKVATFPFTSTGLSMTEVRRPSDATAIVIQSKHLLVRAMEDANTDSEIAKSYRSIDQLLSVGDELVSINNVCLYVIFRRHCDHASTQPDPQVPPPTLITVCCGVMRSLSRPIKLGFVSATHTAKPNTI